MYKGNVIYSSFNLGIENLIITPGVNKYRKGYDVPFDEHRNKANHAICNAEKFIIIGYGFNDDHLETHLMSRIKEEIPTLIITYSITDKVNQLIEENNVTAIYHYDNGIEDGTIVNMKGKKNILTNSKIWDLGMFIREVL